MKENEIMIGDWLRLRYTCRDTGREVVRDFQITEIRKNGETLYAWGKGGNMGRVEKLEPIPITEEILWKYFPKPDFVAWCPSDMPDSKPCYTIQINEDFTHILMDIHYVHELQHALRLCRIDLDIVL